MDVPRPDAPARHPAVVPVFTLVLLSLIGFWPSISGLPTTARPQLTVMLVVLLVSVAVGLPLLVRLAWAGDLRAKLGLAFAGWAIIAAVLSRQPMAWSGEYVSGTGAVFAIGISAYWAIGRWLPERVVPAVAAGFLAGAVTNAVVAMLQGVADLSSIDLPLYDQRSTGFLSNPVFLGASCAAAVALVPVVVRRSTAGGLAVAAVLAAGVQMSGARGSLAVLVVLGLWVGMRCGRRLGAMLVVALVLGLATGALLQGQQTTASARLQSPAGGLGSRLANWRAGLSAAADRPVAGYGPGRWRAATSPRRTLALARADPDRVYIDAHNLIVEHLATAGFVGAGFLVAWLIAVAFGLRGTLRPDLAGAALALLASQMLEPQHLTLTPLMLLVAGAAASARTRPASEGRGTRIAQALLVTTALVVGARLVAGDVELRSGATDFALGPTRLAGGLLWPWPDPVVAESRIHAYQARTEKDPTELAKGLDAARRARRLDPGNSSRSIAVAAFLGQLGRHAEAAQEYTRALALNPWSAQALSRRADELTGLGRLAQARACRMAAQLDAHSDRDLRDARRACLVPRSGGS